ncbi:MAG TPA: glycoside hydrolase [Verrucomicrobiae bacterium]|nr:glycoside hydrolase [Verrucomicrobiae bacterium]
MFSENFYRRRWIAKFATFVLLAGSLATRAQSIYTARINPNAVLVNHFEGWGTSLCWWANVVGGFSNRMDYASLAFSTLKLNIVRYNIGGGENPNLTNTMEFRARIPGFEPSRNVRDWNADKNQRWMLRQAIALGADRVVAFANSPPWWMTVSGSVTGSSSGTNNNLKTADEKLFADYLVNAVSNLTALDGVHFDFVAPMNEPTANWWKLGGRQEGCHMDAAQQARVVSALRAALDARKISAGIQASEDNAEQETIHSVAAYGASQSNVAIIATHTYNANNPDGIRHLAAALDKPVWVSEYGDGDASGMKMARRIRDDITELRARAWIYWQVVDGGGWGFLRNRLNGRNSDFSLNKKFYVMAQFSQFIRPGFQILDVNDNNSLAAYQPTNSTLIIVAINDRRQSLEVTYDLQTFATLTAEIAASRTSPAENEATISPYSVTNKSFTATLIPRSVTTFTLRNITLRNITTH